MRVQEMRAMELSIANTQLQKTLSQVRTQEIELDAQISSLWAQLLAVGDQDTALQSSLVKERIVSEERLALLEVVAGDAMLSAHVELMQEFKNGKSGEWDLDYWI